VPVAVDTDRHDAGDVHDPAALADPLGQRVQERVRVGPRVQMPVPEGRDLLIERRGEAGHWDREMPSMPMARTTSSTRRVDTPST